MNITNIDDRLDLFQVSDVFTAEFIEKIKSLDIANVNTRKEPWDDLREIIVGELALEARDYLNNVVLHEINDFLKSNFVSINCKIWLDKSGYTSPVHIDPDGVQTVFQVYVGTANIKCGTTFYNEDNTEIRKRFDYIENTGYLMINNQSQWHGMLETTTEADNRISIYCLLNAY